MRDDRDDDDDRDDEERRPRRRRRSDDEDDRDRALPYPNQLKIAGYLWVAFGLLILLSCAYFFIQLQDGPRGDAAAVRVGEADAQQADAALALVREKRARAKALAKCEITDANNPKRHWRDDPALMAFLRTL